MEAHGLHRSTMIAERTPAQIYSLVLGLILALVGVIGLFVNNSFDTGTALQADKLLMFEVNGWDSMVYLASGLVGLALAGTARTARTFALGVGVLYAALFVWGLIDTSILGMLPVNDADHVLHAAIAAVGIGAGMAAGSRDESVS